MKPMISLFSNTPKFAKKLSPMESALRVPMLKIIRYENYVIANAADTVNYKEYLSYQGKRVVWDQLGTVDARTIGFANDLALIVRSRAEMRAGL